MRTPGCCVRRDVSKLQAQQAALSSQLQQQQASMQQALAAQASQLQAQQAQQLAKALEVRQGQQG